MLKKYSALQATPEIIPYTPKMKVLGGDNLPRGTGAKYLECMRDHLGNLQAVAWKKTPQVEAVDHILIKFGK